MGKGKKKKTRPPQSKKKGFDVMEPFSPVVAKPKKQSGHSHPIPVRLQLYIVALGC